MSTARVRIGRVRLKAGGTVHLLERAPVAPIVRRLLDFTRDVRAHDEAPVACVAIAFWPDVERPWRRAYLLGWDTIDGSLPLPVLMKVAAAQIEAEGSARIAEGRVMHNLGYVKSEPDPAA
jgi:hypothetical protein